MHFIRVVLDQSELFLNLSGSWRSSYELFWSTGLFLNLSESWRLSSHLGYFSINLGCFWTFLTCWLSKVALRSVSYPMTWSRWGPCMLSIKICCNWHFRNQVRSMSHIWIINRGRTLALWNAYKLFRVLLLLGHVISPNSVLLRLNTWSLLSRLIYLEAYAQRRRGFTD
jgi:hypothetical protein